MHHQSKPSFLSIRDIIGDDATNNATVDEVADISVGSPVDQDEGQALKTDDEAEKSQPLEIPSSPKAASPSFTDNGVEEEEEEEDEKPSPPLQPLPSRLLHPMSSSGFQNGFSPFDSISRPYYPPYSASLGQTGWMYQSLYQRHLMIEGTFYLSQHFSMGKGNIKIIVGFHLRLKIATFIFLYFSYSVSCSHAIIV